MTDTPIRVMTFLWSRRNDGYDYRFINSPHHEQSNIANSCETTLAMLGCACARILPIEVWGWFPIATDEAKALCICRICSIQGGDRRPVVQLTALCTSEEQMDSLGIRHPIELTKATIWSNHQSFAEGEAILAQPVKLSEQPEPEIIDDFHCKFEQSRNTGIPCRIGRSLSTVVDTWCYLMQNEGLVDHAPNDGTILLVSDDSDRKTFYELCAHPFVRIFVCVDEPVDRCETPPGNGTNKQQKSYLQALVEWQTLSFWKRLFTPRPKPSGE